MSTFCNFPDRLQPIQNQPYNTPPDKPARNRAGGVWAHPVSLAATQGVELSFLSSGYLDVSVRPLTFSYPIYSDRDDQTLLWPGFPIRKSAGRRLFSASPRLIAAVHVLHRLLVPRHPPCALSILTENTNYLFVTMQISRCARSRAPQKEPRHRRSAVFQN